jgi:hypothetical protein
MCAFTEAELKEIYAKTKINLPKPDFTPEGMSDVSIIPGSDIEFNFIIDDDGYGTGFEDR